MTDTQDAAQGALGEQAKHHRILWPDGGFWTLADHKTPTGSIVAYCQTCKVMVRVEPTDHNAVRELREALDGLLAKYEKVVEIYVRPNMDYRAKDSSGDVEYTAARAALTHAQGAGAKEVEE